MPRNKHPHIKNLPSQGKVPRTQVNPDDHIGSSLFRWRVNSKYVDYDHEEWGWGKLSCKNFFEMLEIRLHSFEQMSWGDLEQRKHCHPMPVEKIESDAQSRLCEVCNNQNQVDCLYQIDITPRCRLWGYRDRVIFYLIWHDPNHTVYKGDKR